MKILNLLAKILVIVGAVNWGLVGAFHLDLVATLFGDATLLSRIVYILVGIAGLFEIVEFYQCRFCHCGDKGRK